MIRLYQVEWCPWCHSVREVLTELGITYINVNVPAERDDRAEVIEVSGQPGIPVLQDGDKVFSTSDEIIEYLRDTYPEAEDAESHAESAYWRLATLTDLAPAQALARLKKLLKEHDFVVVAQTRGPRISKRLPEEYVILQAAVPAAAVKAVELDPLAHAAVLLPIAVMPVSEGSVVSSADPVGQVWLFAEPALTKLQAAVKKRLIEVFEEL
jgi:glutathione S-transferase